MKIILLKDVAKLGRKFDVKDVSNGHALNLLIPQGLALSATPEALKRLEKDKARVEGERKVQDDLMEKNASSLADSTLTIVGKANDKGHLFAGLHAEAIAAELAKQNKIVIDPAHIELTHPIKEVGEHTIQVKVGGKAVNFKLVVQAK